MACVSDAAHTSPSPSPSPSRPALLRLTPDIRLRLYRYLGLASWNGHPYLFDLRGGRAEGRKWPGTPPVPIDFHGLLISCRIIYAEAAALLYSANSFVVHYYAPAQPPGLYSLDALTEVALHSLSQLKIVVNEAACHNRVTGINYTLVCCCHGHDNGNWSGLIWCRQKHSDLHQAPLLSDGMMSADDARHAWHAAAARLFSRNAPGRLALSFVCDIDPQHPLALDLAASILSPLRLLPRAYLSECRIRLAKTPDWPLEQLARDAAVYACGLPTPIPDASPEPLGAAATATLTSLSRELRIRILEYTNLVTPRRQVAWSRQGRAYIVNRFEYMGDHPTPDDLHSDQFFWCSRDRPEGCFCRRRHAVFSLDCKCWAPPGPTLFLVCRTISQEAQYVFFSRNRFIIHDYKAYPVWHVPSLQQRSSPGLGELPDSLECDSYPFEKFAASEFLRDIVPTSALAHLRFLELVFPPYASATWPRPEHPAARDWLSTVAWLRGRLNLPGLTLRVVAMDVSNGAPDSFGEATAEEITALLKVYMDLVRPLRGLAEPPGLARFYAHFRYPRERSLDAILNDPFWQDYDEANEPPQSGPWYDPWLHKKDLKERLERFVMGARYQSLYADGREEPRASDWDVMYFGGSGV